MDTLTGKKALVTGAARGQGRAHALTLARAGVDLVLVDIHRDFDSVPYPMSTVEELEETAIAARAEGVEVLSFDADVRERKQLRDVVAEASDIFGALDIVVANAGICPPTKPFWEIDDDQWNVTMDVNAKGVFNTVAEAVPRMIERGRGGSVIVTASLLGLRGSAHLVDYTAAKHAVVGMMKSMALALGPHSIRVNALCPNSVNTKMIDNDAIFRAFRPDLESPTREDTIEVFKTLNVMPAPWLEPQDIAEAMLFLASDRSRFMTGVAVPVDLGGSVR